MKSPGGETEALLQFGNASLVKALEESVFNFSQTCLEQKNEALLFYNKVNNYDIAVSRPTTAG